MMKHKVGDVVKVVRVYSGGCFVPGDIVEITRIGDEDGEDLNCYGAISPYDGRIWYLQEDECESLIVTNADRIRSMTDEELAEFLCFNHWSESSESLCLQWLQNAKEI